MLMQHHVYMGPGRYCTTLYTAATDTGTLSMAISDGVSDQSLMDWPICAVRCVEVLPVCPGLDVNVISGITVPSTYSDTNNSSRYIPTVVSTPYHIVNEYLSISGYAPNLTVRVSGLAIPRSLPLSAVVIDYGDPFDDSPTAYSIERVDVPTQGWPIWNGITYITGDHTYTMPGVYDLSIYAKTREPTVSTRTSATSANCADLVKNFVVVVHEIPLTACFTFGPSANLFNNIPVSGVSPVTVYFNPSCTQTGSFPICKIVWDFGDGSDLVTISRYVSTSFTNIINSSAYDLDINDPRNIIVYHDYSISNNIECSTYVATMTAFACNTDSYDMYSAQVVNVEIPTLADDLGDVHLIANRIPNKKDDVVLTFEGERQNDVLTVLVSSQYF
jgi:hypothetical protein